MRKFFGGDKSLTAVGREKWDPRRIQGQTLQKLEETWTGILSESENKLIHGQVEQKLVELTLFFFVLFFFNVGF